jgi:orotidine-5'-phosphate decarboxylase
MSEPSRKPIPVRERLILALDVGSPEEARGLVEALGDHVGFYKIGLTLFMCGGYFELLQWLTDRGKKVFVDLKYFDVPQTVAGAVAKLRRYRASFATVHGNEAILKAACAEKGDTKILGVTVLTSMDRNDLIDLGFPDTIDVRALVLSRARRALAAGCDGVVASGLEAVELRNELGTRLLIVVPGIRPFDNVDDQKRTVDVEQAFRNGADYIVVGRPILNAPSPTAAAEQVQERIAALFAQS